MCFELTLQIILSTANKVVELELLLGKVSCLVLHQLSILPSQLLSLIKHIALNALEQTCLSSGQFCCLALLVMHLLCCALLTMGLLTAHAEKALLL